MNKNRRAVIELAFKKLDRDNTGQITVDDLRGVYNVKSHPKYLNGDLTEEQLLKQYLNNFEVDKHKDGIVSYDEFLQCKIFV
jgi:Ca2+-binding EF-hand superfamily protein